MKVTFETKYKIGDIVHRIEIDDEGYKILQYKVRSFSLSIVNNNEIGTAGTKDGICYRIESFHGGKSYNIFEKYLYDFEGVKKRIKEYFKD